MGFLFNPSPCLLFLSEFQPLQSLIGLDHRLFSALNSLHANWLDPIVYAASRNNLFWLPLYLVLLWIVIRDYKYQSWIILLSIALTITLTDQITSGVMKPLFARPRPSHDPLLAATIHIVNGYRGGSYGFASGHAANTFGIATLFYLLMRKHYPWIGWIFLWAGLVAYTRIYLGVHFPGDVLVGALVGMACAWLVYRLMRYFTIRYYLKQRIFRD